MNCRSQHIPKMSIFDDYCKDLDFMYDDISRNLADLRNRDTSISNSDFEKYEKTINAVFDQSDDLVKQAEIETRSHASAERKLLLERVKEYKDRFSDLRERFKNESNRLQKALLVGTKSGDAKIRLMESSEKIERQNETIANCLRTVAETEALGTETLEELGRNRERIESAREKGQEFAGLTDQADKRIKSMSWRHKTWGLFG